MRLVDADYLKTRAIRVSTTKEHCYIKAVGTKEIDKAPTVDAVSVVRCKDCKYFVQTEPYDPDECMKWMVKWGVAYTDPDGYCHKGERKDNETD